MVDARGVSCASMRIVGSLRSRRPRWARAFPPACQSVTQGACRVTRRAHGCAEAAQTAGSVSRRPRATDAGTRQELDGPSTVRRRLAERAAVSGRRPPTLGGLEMLGQAALAGQVADDLPGELARRGVGVLPAVHGRDGDRDLVRELLLREAELLPQAADEVSGVWVHVSGFSEVVECCRVRWSRQSNPHAMRRAFGAGGGCARQRAMRSGDPRSAAAGRRRRRLRPRARARQPRGRRCGATSQALKAEKFDDAYDLVSKAMRQGKDKEEYVKEQTGA